MLTKALDAVAEFVAALLIHYSFELGGYTAGELINRWLNDYPANWVRLAVIEALYQGRYKAISVEQILAFWNRRGQAFYHFNHEFERLVCDHIPQTLSDQPETRANPSPPVPKEAVSFSNGHASHPPIEQFTPKKTDDSDFYTKLKAIVEQPEEGEGDFGVPFGGKGAKGRNSN